MTKYITKTNLYYDPKILEEELNKVIHLIDSRNQLCVNTVLGAIDPLYDGVGRLRDGVKEGDYSIINDIFVGSIFEKIILDLKIVIGRARIMKLVPQHTMWMHPDPGIRYHIALKTNPNCFIFFRDTCKSYHIPTDGYVYKMDATKWHTAFNAGKLDRYHFVIADGSECNDTYIKY